jgi:hypothetical protein
MVQNLESLILDVRYIINNADKLSNPKDYIQIISKIQYIISSSNAKFYEGIKRKRMPFYEIERYMDLDSILINGCSTIGSIEIARILRFSEKAVSNVIDIICIDQQRAITQRDTITNYIKMKRYKYKFLPNNIYGFRVSLNEELIIPNLYGIYFYIKVDLSNLKLYITINMAGNLFIKKNGLNYILYFNDFGLFSIIYKFFRYKDKDIKDLEEYEKYKDKIKEIINKGFNDRDIDNLRRLFSEKDIDKIRKNLDKYLEKHPGSVYKSLYKVIEYV